MASLGYTVNSRPDVENKGLFGGWRDSLMLTVLAALTGYSFNSQPHVVAYKPSVTPVPWDPALSF